MKFQNNCFNCFAALSTPARIEIVALLQKRERMSVSEIVKHIKLTQPTITHHLKYLEKAGILKSQKMGKKVYYYLAPVCLGGGCHLFD
ncbi:MAG: metalloregulator ArsR/SmtB family transcription factor [Candidatus Daviesbacteria bacterium]|nr:metalloregulator ArsR/SmtB family transcription factor [Candidatus Daviesbacteria bacterium]